MKVVIVTCLWKRPEISDRVLARYVAARHNLSDVVDLDFVAVGSEEEASAELAQRHGWQYVEAPNRPLGGKWNHGLARAREMEADAVVIVGSDDWVSDGILRHHVARLEDGVQLSTVAGIYVMCAKTLKCLYFSGPTGVGRCVHKSILDKLDWKLWRDEKNGRLDAEADSQIRTTGKFWSHRKALAKIDQASMVDIKSTTNMWSFGQIERRSAPSAAVDFEEVFRHFDPREVDELVKVLASSQPT